MPRNVRRSSRFICTLTVLPILLSLPIATAGLAEDHVTFSESVHEHSDRVAGGSEDATRLVAAHFVQTIYDEFFAWPGIEFMAGLRPPRPLSDDEARKLKPFDQFQECEVCPEMVVVPAGEFLMGAPESEEGSTADERPQHRVRIARPFAVGRFAVTFDQWDACVAGSGCHGYRPPDQGWGRGHQPVINILWEEAKAYVAWLSRKTNRPYRLLSEAEREYVTRAGTSSPFWWASSITPAQANYDWRLTYPAVRANPDDNFFDLPVVISQPASPPKRTLPVDSFAPNPWGLYQVHGNVYDWVEDCWHNDYRGAPTDGSAWTEGECRNHVLRGGAFSRAPATLRSAARIWFGPGHRMIYMSLRVARTLPR